MAKKWLSNSSNTSQTPFGFDGGLDAPEMYEFGETTAESQTPFGFDGGLDQTVPTGWPVGFGKSQTPFGFDGGLDAWLRPLPCS